MKTVHFKCIRVAPKLPLDKISAFFKIHRQLSWKEYIRLQGYPLEMILKYTAASKQVYLYEFGCVCFINFDDSDIGVFVEFLESLTGPIDYTSYVKFQETHGVEIFDNGNCSLWEGSPGNFKYGSYTPHIVSTVLAKSTALSRLETEVSLLLDQSEKFINYLQKGWLHASTKNSAKITAQFLRFKYDSITNIRIFDRPSFSGQHLSEREEYTALSKYFELFERYEILQSKISDLHSITDAYSKLSYRQSENRLYVFEIFLLALFPLSGLIHFLLDRYGYSHVIKLLF